VRISLTLLAGLLPGLLAGLLATSATAHAAPKVLDLEVVGKDGGSFVVRDAAYEVTFTGSPKLEEGTQGEAGTHIKTGTAEFQLTEREDLMFMVMPVPKQVTFDPVAAVKGARDGVVTEGKGKILKERKETIGGLSLNHVTLSATAEGVAVHVDLYVGWDKVHRSMIMLLTTIAGDAQTPAAAAFVKSFKMKKTGAAPPAGDGT